MVPQSALGADDHAPCDAACGTNGREPPSPWPALRRAARRCGGAPPGHRCVSRPANTSARRALARPRGFAATQASSDRADTALHEAQRAARQRPAHPQRAPPELYSAGANESSPADGRLGRSFAPARCPSGSNRLIDARHVEPGRSDAAASSNHPGGQFLAGLGAAPLHSLRVVGLVEPMEYAIDRRSPYLPSNGTSIEPVTSTSGDPAICWAIYQFPDHRDDHHTGRNRRADNQDRDPDRKVFPAQQPSGADHAGRKRPLHYRLGAHHRIRRRDALAHRMQVSKPCVREPPETGIAFLKPTPSPSVLPPLVKRLPRRSTGERTPHQLLQFRE
jgi:hypothetical protein